MTSYCVLAVLNENPILGVWSKLLELVLILIVIPSNPGVTPSLRLSYTSESVISFLMLSLVVLFKEPSVT